MAWKRKKKKKHWVINLTKDVQDLYTKNYKTSLKEIKEDLNKEEDIWTCGLENLILRWQWSPKWYTDLVQSLLKF